MEGNGVRENPAKDSWALGENQPMYGQAQNESGQAQNESGRIYAPERNGNQAMYGQAQNESGRIYAPEQNENQPMYRWAQNEAKENISGWWFAVVAVLCALLLLNGCKTITQTEKEYVYSTDTLYQKVIEKDSVYVQDSIVIRQKGDTVYNDRWHVRYIEKLRIDTLYQSRVDSVYVDVEKVVEKQISPRERMKMFLSDAGMLVFFGAIVFLILKLLRWYVKVKARL